ncbi:PiggyBac transposable element-derived protein 1 [Eumeta japonica]|uniref:PiggyBac transposable element-derived protein 1 n=1 Tax=Eumeta variegata TaxID=151549 RepID=A0A4C2AAG3_EUMVA|nr:PiggyBac transposable element-derived protein 1 [Eumeta japonica]
MRIVTSAAVRQQTLIATLFTYYRLMLDEITELLAEEDPGDIILFSTDGVVTDEDSGDGNEANILHIASRMLRSQVELQNRPSTSGDNRMDDMEEEEEIDVPAPKKKKDKRQYYKKNCIAKLCSNTPLLLNNKFAKVRKYFTKLNVNFTAHLKKAGSSHIFVDEDDDSTILRKAWYQTSYSRKTDKVQLQATSSVSCYGYLVNCEPYQGASDPGLKMQSDLGLRDAVILELYSRLPQELGPYNLYFYNFFTGLPLLKHLREQNVGGTGTVRENRLEN